MNSEQRKCPVVSWKSTKCWMTGMNGPTGWPHMLLMRQLLQQPQTVSSQGWKVLAPANSNKLRKRRVTLKHLVASHCVDRCTVKSLVNVSWQGWLTVHNQECEGRDPSGRLLNAGVSLFLFLSSLLNVSQTYVANNKNARNHVCARVVLGHTSVLFFGCNCVLPVYTIFWNGAVPFWDAGPQ